MADERKSKTTRRRRGETMETMRSFDEDSLRGITPLPNRIAVPRIMVEPSSDNESRLSRGVQSDRGSMSSQNSWTPNTASPKRHGNLQQPNKQQQQQLQQTQPTPRKIDRETRRDDQNPSPRPNGSKIASIPPQGASSPSVLPLPVSNAQLASTADRDYSRPSSGKGASPTSSSSNAPTASSPDSEDSPHRRSHANAASHKAGRDNRGFQSDEPTSIRHPITEKDATKARSGPRMDTNSNAQRTATKGALERHPTKPASGSFLQLPTPTVGKANKKAPTPIKSETGRMLASSSEYTRSSRNQMSKPSPSVTFSVKDQVAEERVEIQSFQPDEDDDIGNFEDDFWEKRAEYGDQDRRGSWQSIASLAASDVSIVSNLSAISARCQDMSYIYQVYDDRKQNIGNSQQPQSPHNGRLEDDLVTPWDPPVPYHLAAFKDDKHYAIKLRILSFILHATLFIILLAMVGLGLIGMGNPSLLGVVENPNDAVDPEWQQRLKFAISPLGGKYRLDKLDQQLLSFYLTDHFPCLTFHVNRFDQFWFYQAGSEVDLFYFNSSGRYQTRILGNAVLNDQARFEVRLNKDTTVGAIMRKGSHGAYAMINVFFTDPIADFDPEAIRAPTEAEMKAQYPSKYNQNIFDLFFKDGISVCPKAANMSSTTTTTTTMKTKKANRTFLSLFMGRKLSRRER